MSIPCPCGGTAYSRDEMQAMDGNDPRANRFWESVMGEDSYYCPEEDDQLTADEVARMKVARDDS